ncbi:MAG: hypothetical protein DI585_04355 [Pseudomonas fluorescens]|nr:MAG: hypothetical protein DI585_04355 [Pseudomonas fluorescens]
MARSLVFREESILSEKLAFSYLADIFPYIADDKPYFTDDKSYIADDKPYISDTATSQHLDSYAEFVTFCA